jgi:hypothetical protein
MARWIYWGILTLIAIIVWSGWLGAEKMSYDTRMITGTLVECTGILILALYKK